MMNNGTSGLKCLVPIIAVFAVIFGWQWLFHGHFMMPDYVATAALWRPEAEMQNLMWVCFVTKALMAFAIVGLFCACAQGCESGGRCPAKGAKFGLMIGLILGAHDFASYMWLPIPMEIAVKWFIGDIIMGVLIGVVLAFLKGMCSKGECKA